MVKNLLICTAIFLFAGSLHSQNSYVDAKKLPVPDCREGKTPWNEFDRNAKKIGKVTVVPDNPSDKAGFAKIRQYLGDVKKESELTEEDLTKALDIYGVLTDFKDWERLGVPITKIDKGFRFENTKYEAEQGAIRYVNEKRHVLVGNSSAPISTLFATLMFYEYMTLKDGLLSKVKVKDAPVIDLDRIRETNYDKLESKYFNCFVDKKLSGSENVISDSIIIDICRKLELPLPDFKINAYMSADPNATRLFANFYAAKGCDTLPSDERFGTIQLGAIHCVGTDSEFVLHESVHFVWNKFVPLRNLNEFLNEGIQTYYQFSRNSNNFSRALESQKKYIAHDMRDWILVGSASSFWGGPSEDGWPAAYNISGVFVKFLIDGWGMDKFKEFYTYHGKEEGLASIYGMSLDETLERYHKWISEFD